MNYPLFTVIIPQKDRAEYLMHTLRTCMIQDYPNFEIIVGDDCSEDNSVEMVRDLQRKDSRIKLIAHEQHVGMRDNFESALNEVKEGYVIALGGDDGLVPGCIWRMYDIIKETGTQLLTWKTPGFLYPDNPDGTSLVSVRKEKFKGYKFVNSRDFLNRVSQSMFYLVDECPMFYVKGVASIDLINRVKERTPDHNFYYCPTPDGFSGIVLAGEVEQYVYTNEPLSINGATIKSQGKAYHRTDEQSRKAARQFFDDSTRKHMHKDLASQPYSPLVTLMTADYLLTARDLPGWPGEFDMFTYSHLIRKTFDFMKNSSFANDVLVRELRILREIAVQHGELDLFNELMKKSKRRIVNKNIVDGFFVTKNAYSFNAKSLGISNIFDASLITPSAYRMCNKVSLRSVFCYLVRVVKVAYCMVRRKAERFPEI